jgi:DNA (cytosine-5)-methyltransferase 1
MSWLYSRALVEEYSVDTCLDGAQSALWSGTPTLQASWLPAKMTEPYRLSRSGMTFQTFDGRPWRGRVDVVSGGFPCQDISTAGGPNRKGLEGERSGLWSEMLRIVCEVEPPRVFVENSPALTFRGLGTVLGQLAEVGYDAKWGVFSAGDVGARHQRERIWIVANYRDSVKTAKVQERKVQEPCFESFRAMSEGISSVPGMGRKADGLAYWMDRLATLGNGQVPAVAKTAFDFLS